MTAAVLPPRLVCETLTLSPLCFHYGASIFLWAFHFWHCSSFPLQTADSHTPPSPDPILFSRSEYLCIFLRWKVINYIYSSSKLKCSFQVPGLCLSASILCNSILLLHYILEGNSVGLFIPQQFFTVSPRCKTAAFQEANKCQYSISHKTKYNMKSQRSWCERWHFPFFFTLHESCRLVSNLTLTLLFHSRHFNFS